jgi:hypothetical protein
METELNLLKISKGYHKQYCKEVKDYVPIVLAVE